VTGAAQAAVILSQAKDLCNEPLNFGFSILDFGLAEKEPMKSEIENPKLQGRSRHGNHG
jgi:hypothetical protein